MAFKDSFLSAIKSFKGIWPIVLGVVLLVSLVIAAVPKDAYTKVFTGNKMIDPLLGAVVGSVASGDPITSYIIGGELLKQGVSLIAVTAFILAWVTVGFIQLPVESAMLGKRFAISRNLLSFITSLAVSVLVVLTLSLL